MTARASGVLLPIFSLPGDYGCGTMGRYADAFLDFLSDSGQKYWQILPLVPIGAGHSPYMSPSAFGGNPYFIDPEALVAAGWLTAEELAATVCTARDRVDYDYLEQVRMPLLRLAWLRAKGENLPELAAFRRAEAHWLAGYCAFVAADAQAADEGEFCAFLQWLFFTQWQKLRMYAHGKNIRIIGDLPIYVSPVGADVAQHPELFLRDEAGNFAAVAGVPPDAFTALGQLWGNPLYDWEGNR
ncbi:MAG: 4-alpha-glucanotransferase, partial [Pseudoflavonifractor sp.]